MALPDDILVEIQELKRRLDNLERYPQPPTIVTGDLVSAASFALEAAGTPGDIVKVTTTIHNENSQLMMAVPMWTLYQWELVGGSVISYEWPFNGIWTNDQIRNLDIVSYIPQYEAFQESPNDMSVNVVLRNRGATRIGALQLFVSWRFPQLQGGQV